MRAAGATVLRPETQSVEEQLRAYVEAATVIFAEGSAVQSTRLLGRSLGDVVVMRRRPGDRIAEDGLRPRAASLRYWDALDGVVSGLDANDMPFEVLGLSILDPERLLLLTSEVLPRLAEVWAGPSYAAARDADVLAWLACSLESPRVAGTRSSAHILASMETCGLSHLLTVARSLIADRQIRDGGGQ